MSESSLLPPQLDGGTPRGPSARTWLLVLIVAVGIAVWGIFGRLQARAAVQAGAEEAVAPVVATVPVKKVAGGDSLVLPATVSAYQDAPMYARTSGYVKRWTVDIGAHVKAGELLAELDTPEVDQQLRQAEADLKTAQANEAIAKSTAERWKALLETQAVSQQDADQKQADYAAKKATTDSALANVQRLRETQGFQKIVAPFAGTVTARHLNVGQLVTNGGGTELYHVADTRRLRVYVQVPQAYAPEARPGVEADVVFAERPGQHFASKIVSTADALDATTRTLQVQLLLDNEQGKLFPGAYAEVHLKLAAAGESLRIPSNALLFGTDGLHVAVVDATHHVSLKSIVPGRDFGADMEVLSGLVENDQVVVNPPDSLADGAEVRLIEKKPAKAPEATAAGSAATKEAK